MKQLTKSVLVGSAAIGLAFGGFGVAAAVAGGGSSVPNEVDEPGEETDIDTPLTGTNLDSASAAALEHTGEGTVTETEVGDDGAAYGIEVRLDDGSQVEVNLDADFNVIGSAPDDE
jgi:uncharacterized membrane protein YkoI